MVEYRFLHDTEELEDFIDLQCIIWDMDSRNAVPSNIMHALILSGGVAIGAYDAGQAIGMSLGLPWRQGDQWGIWSHMTGVHPDYQDQGIGFDLKQRQRDWAIGKDYKTIRWTFDPMQRLNANFNLHILGVTSRIYHIDLYGDTLGELNAGLPTDRLEVVWQLEDRRVLMLSRRQTPAAFVDDYFDEAFLIRLGDDGRLYINPSLSLSYKTYFIEIPYDVMALKQADLPKANEWLMALRQLMQEMFRRDYAAVDFIVQGRRCWYVLCRTQDYPDHIG